jgi:hypothetical protein
MATSTKEVVMYGCDAPECDVARPDEDGRPPSKGTSGLVNLPDGGNAEFYACRVSHISKAVQAAQGVDVAATEGDDEDGQPDVDTDAVDASPVEGYSADEEVPAFH